MEDTIDLASTTLMDPAILAHPNAFYRAMRREDPIHYDKNLDMYLISRYDDLQTVLRDPVTFSVNKGFAEQYAKGFLKEYREILERDGGGFFANCIMTDPPQHTRVRRLLDLAFTAHRVKSLQAEIEAIATDLVDRLLANGGGEIFSEFAMPMTSRIICRQLGVDLPSETVQRWALSLVQQISRMQNREDMLRAARDICELQNFLLEQIRDRQASPPRDDMISDLVHAKIDDPEKPTLDLDELVSLGTALLVAGNETTATALTTMFYILATRPDLRETVRAGIDDDRVVSRFVEELLRFDAPVRGITRMTMEDVEVGGVKLPKGAHLLLLYASANDDDAEFPDPREFDISRPNLGKHLSFGAGVHRCAGAALARMQLKVALREILTRIDSMELAIPAGEITYTPTVATHTIARLPLRLTAL
ncbi:MAG TPA: cytochrome P450 [Novosphingobium sp.]|nr:cytochrome P450 [Novosphingobium sp.]